MSDPRRHIKSLGRIVIKTKIPESGEDMNILTFADRNMLKNTSQEQIEKTLKEEMKKISVKPNTTVFRTLTSFAYSEKDAMKDFDFGSVLVEANLPYCLHIPNHLESKVLIKEQNFEALVTFRKFWTKRAEADEDKSDTIDFYAETIPLYFSKGTTLGPHLPYREEEGWEQFITGRNIEKINDQNGTFRYTKIYIQFKSETPENINNLSDKQLDSVLDDIQNKSLIVANRIIDNYREITKEIHVRNLGTLAVNLIYFIPQNTGFYLSPLNITTAMINRSRKEIKELTSQLSLGQKPELYKLIILNAKNSFDSGSLTLAVVESFQALEIFLENYLIDGFIKRGDKEKIYKDFLKKNWATKDRLNEGLKELKNKKANTQKFWNKWCLCYDQTRNEVIHAGKEPKKDEVGTTLQINEEVINWILSL